jgi:hypothetical protein
LINHIYRFFLFIYAVSISAQNKYSWTDNPSNLNVSKIPVPSGYSRIQCSKGDFSDWLRNIPLVEEDRAVLLYNKTPKNRQDVHFKIIDIDLGKENLQQCADAVMRLRAEYFYSKNLHDSIVFFFTNGFKASWNKWKEGYRIKISGNECSWYKSAIPDASYYQFRKYLNIVFNYCGTYSLHRDTYKSKSKPNPGNFYVQGGFPGHAAIIVDVCYHPESGKYFVLLAQSYMPAQEIHILKNLSNTKLSPWYEWNSDGSILTPEWAFPPNSLHSFTR